MNTNTPPIVGASRWEAKGLVKVGTDKILVGANVFENARHIMHLGLVYVCGYVCVYI